MPRTTTRSGWKARTRAPVRRPRTPSGLREGDRGRRCTPPERHQGSTVRESHLRDRARGHSGGWSRKYSDSNRPSSRRADGSGALPRTAWWARARSRSTASAGLAAECPEQRNADGQQRLGVQQQAEDSLPDLRPRSDSIGVDVGGGGPSPLSCAGIAATCRSDINTMLLIRSPSPRCRSTRPARCGGPLPPRSGARSRGSASTPSTRPGAEHVRRRAPAGRG